jgi:hypothetical protein
MDLSFLRPLYERPGPDYVSVYADTSRDSENAARAVDLRWREISAGLSRDGADADGAQLWILPGSGAADDAEADLGDGARPDQEDQNPALPADGVAAALRAPLAGSGGQPPEGSS